MLMSVFVFVLVNEFVIVSVNSSVLKSSRYRRLSPVTEGLGSNIAESIASGTQMAIDHCQSLFQWERWNCPKSTFNRQQRLISTKETAFSKAIIAAGIAHSITKNCSQGQIEGCKCQNTDKFPIDQQLKYKNHQEKIKTLSGDVRIKKEVTENVTKGVNNDKNVEWRWGGCSDNPMFASQITEKIIDSMETGIDVPAYISRHNAKVGIKIIQSSMRRKCRCHGISGSCTTQTCWIQVAPFEEISRKLKDLHRKSVRVTHNAVEKSIIIGNSASDVLVQVKEIPGTENRLIYMVRSPDYCVTNFTKGYLGTKGRMCSRNRSNVTKMEKNSCRNVCKKCGHTVKRMQKKVARRCNCKFSWCCEVKCDTCHEVVNEHFCV